MKRFGLLVLLVAGVMALSATPSHGAAVWKQFNLKFQRTAGPQDTVNIASTAKTDSVRTVEFPLEQIAWDALSQTSTTGIGLNVTFTTTAASADTVEYGVELGWAGKWQRVDGIEATAAVTSVATGGDGTTGASGGGKIFMGKINIDPDTWAAANNNVMGKPLMRLFVRNNAAVGTLTGLTCTITAPVHVGMGPFPRWRAIPVKFQRTTARDTVNIGAAADSVRTVSIPLSGVDWESLRGGNGAAVTTGTVIFADSASTMDSLYFVPEIGYKGVFQYANPLAITATAASAATPGGTCSTQVTGDGTLMFGQLQIDPDTYTAAANNLYGKPEFRLHIRGRANTGVVYGLKCWIVLPWINN